MSFLNKVNHSKYVDAIMKLKFFITALSDIILLSCQPILHNGFDPKSVYHKTNGNQCTPINSYVMDIDNAFVGKWRMVDEYRTGDTSIITISKEEIWIPYQGPTLYWIIDENNIRVHRLFLDERNAAYEDTCPYWFNHDTLTITSMWMSFSAVYPPRFHDIIIKRVPK